MFQNLAAAAATGSRGGMWVYYLIIVLMFGSLYFFSIRPQNKREKELKNLRESLEVGDEIMTIGGIYGTVVRIKDDRVTVATGAEKCKIEFSKSAISTVLNREIPKDGSKKAEEKPARKIKKLSAKEDETVDEIPEEITEE